MIRSRHLPKFDAAHFASLSHEEKLKLLNDFLDALNPAERAREGSEEATPRTRQAREST